MRRVKPSQRMCMEQPHWFGILSLEAKYPNINILSFLQALEAAGFL